MALELIRASAHTYGGVECRIHYSASLSQNITVPGLVQGVVESVSTQTVEISDNGAASHALPNDSRVRFISRAENRGLSAACNTGLKYARDHHAALLDDDDLCLHLRRLAIGLGGPFRAPTPVCRLQSITTDSARCRESLASRLEGDVHDNVFEDRTPQAGSNTLERYLALLLDETYPAGADAGWWWQCHRPSGRRST